MKKIILVVLTVFISSIVICQVKISIDSVTKHYGEKVTVCSKVYGTKALEKVTFINLGAAYPNSLLTIVIFTKDKSKFKEAPEAIRILDILFTSSITFTSRFNITAV